MIRKINRSTILLLALGGLHAVDAQAQSRCDALKLTCIAKREACILAVEAKGLKIGQAWDGTKYQKCLDSFDGGPEPSKGCVTKLEVALSDCGFSNSTSALVTIGDDFVEAISTQVVLDHPAVEPPNSCHSGLLTCVARQMSCVLKVAQKSIQKDVATSSPALARCSDKFSEPVSMKGCIDKVYAKQNPAKPETLCDLPNDGSLERTIDASIQTILEEVTGVRQIIDASGDGASTLFTTYDIAVDASGSGNVFVVGYNSDNAFRIAPDGVITRIIDSTADGVPLETPSSVATDATGNVFVAGESSHNVFKITPGGSISQIIDATGDGAHGLTRPVGLAVDAGGNVFVAARGANDWAFGGNVFKIEPGGAIAQIVDPTGDGVHPLYRPNDVATDAAGNVFVVGGGSDNAFEISPGGAISQIIGSTGDGTHALDFPSSIATDSFGNVYVVGQVSNNVFKIAPSGTISQILDAAGDGVHPMVGASGIAVDAVGNVYVSALGEARIFRVSPSGRVSRVASTVGDGLHPLSNPYQIATDPMGFVYAAGSYESDAFRIERP